MRMPHFVAGMLSVGLIVPGADGVSAQNYLSKPVRIVTTGIGGGSDFVARVIAQGLAGPLGQPVIVENRAAAILSEEIVSKALPDGYTLLVDTEGLWLGPFLQKMPFDPVNDFSPITLAVRSPNVLVVHPSAPVKSVQDLIALAKARPGQLNYAMSIIGGSNHLAAELFKAMAGVNIVGVPHKSGAAAILSLLGGEVQLAFVTAGTGAPYFKSERLRALAVTSARPSALFPGLPTIAASGLPGYEYGTFYGMLAPAKTPEAIINRLNRDTVRVVNQADSKEKFLNIGSEIVGSSPKEFAAIIKSEMARMGKVIKDAGIRAE